MQFWFLEAGTWITSNDRLYWFVGHMQCGTNVQDRSTDIGLQLLWKKKHCVFQKCVARGLSMIAELLVGSGHQHMPLSIEDMNTNCTNLVVTALSAWISSPTDSLMHGKTYHLLSNLLVYTRF